MMNARLPPPVLCIFAIFGGCHLFAADPAMLWDPAVPLPRAVDMPVIAGTRFAVIKPYEFNKDGYRFLHGVGLAWHKDRLYASFGHNKGGENTGSEEARGRVSDDGGRTWGETFTIDSGEEPDLAVSHGVFLSHGGRLHAFMGASYGTMKRVHTRGYVLDEATGPWAALGGVVDGGGDSGGRRSRGSVGRIDADHAGPPDHEHRPLRGKGSRTRGDERRLRSHLDAVAAEQPPDDDEQTLRGPALERRAVSDLHDHCGQRQQAHPADDRPRAAGGEHLFAGIGDSPQ